MSRIVADSDPVRRIGFVGLGKMGAPMVRHLAARAGQLVTAYDADPERLNGLVEAVGEPLRAARSLDDLADCEVVITMLPNSHITSTVLAGEGGSLSRALRIGATVVDMGSSDPMETERLYVELAERGITLLDAPVSGSVAKAENGQLSIMVGGDVAQVERVRPVLEVMGSVILPTGRVGSAHAMKALNNYVYAAGLLASCEALLAAQRMGLDLKVFVDILNASSGRNVSTETKLSQFILSGSFKGGFSLPLQAKDLATANRLGETVGLRLPQLALVEELWSRAVEQMPAGADNTEMFRFLKSMQSYPECP